MTSEGSGEAQRVQANIRKLSLLRASHMFLVVMPVIVPFYRASGLDMREVYLLQSVFAVGTLLLEVPAGYAADLLGRKKTRPRAPAVRRPKAGERRSMLLKSPSMEE